jgi:hypothetical protein
MAHLFRKLFAVVAFACAALSSREPRAQTITVIVAARTIAPLVSVTRPLIKPDFYGTSKIRSE